MLIVGLFRIFLGTPLKVFFQLTHWKKLIHSSQNNLAWKYLCWADMLKLWHALRELSVVSFPRAEALILVVLTALQSAVLGSWSWQGKHLNFQLMGKCELLDFSYIDPKGSCFFFHVQMSIRRRVGRWSTLYLSWKGKK